MDYPKLDNYIYISTIKRIFKTETYNTEKNQKNK